MPPPVRLAGRTIQGKIGTYRVNTASDVQKCLRFLREQLRTATPKRRRRILADIDRLLDRILEIREESPGFSRGSVNAPSAPARLINELLGSPPTV